MRPRLVAAVGACGLLLGGCSGAHDRPAPAARPVPPPGRPAPPPGLTRLHSGLLAREPFTSPAPVDALGARFELNGSAPAAGRRVAVDAAGLHIGVVEHPRGTWEGFFAVTRVSFPATAVFHVRMYRRPGDVGGAQRAGESVFAVQTATTKRTGQINYALVATSSTRGRTHWLAGYAEGRIADARTTVLWSGPAPGPLDEDVTVRTDGHSTLDVYLGGRRVLAARRLRMSIAPPFQPYLEVQGLGAAYASRFQDFWVAEDTALTVRGLRPGDAVALRTRAGTATGRAAADGSARLPLSPPLARGTGALTISGSRRLSVSGLDYAGGDVYRPS